MTVRRQNFRNSENDFFSELRSPSSEFRSSVIFSKQSFAANVDVKDIYEVGSLPNWDGFEPGNFTFEYNFDFVSSLLKPARLGVGSFNYDSSRDVGLPNVYEASSLPSWSGFEGGFNIGNFVFAPEFSLDFVLNVQEPAVSSVQEPARIGTGSINYEYAGDVDLLQAELLTRSLATEGALQEALDLTVGYHLTQAGVIAPSGTGLNDTVVGGVDNDTLFGMNGHDVILGGDGNDTLYGNDGNDTIYGDGGDDTLSGGFGDDTLVGGSGTNSLDGGGGLDTAVYGGSYQDYVISSSGSGVSVQSLDGTSVNDTLTGIEQIRFGSDLYTVDALQKASEAGTVPAPLDTADTPTLSVPGTITAAFANETDSLSVALDISAALTDTDGSETLQVRVSGLPTGATLSAGAAQSDGSWLLNAGEIAGVMIDLPPTVTDDFQLAIVAEAQESADGSIAVVDGVVTVDVLAYAAPIVVVPTPDLVRAPDPVVSSIPLGEGEIVVIGVENNTESSVPGDYKTFGHVFVEGDLPAGKGLVAIIDGMEYQVQVDVKATWDDGSAKHAVLTMVTPALGAGQSVDAVLTLQDTGLADADLTTADVFATGYDLQVKIDLDNGDGTTTNYVVDAATWMQAAIDEGRIETWIDGPFASEFSFRAKLPGHDHLEVRFDVRIFANGDIRTDVTVANESTYTPGIETFQYGATIIEGGDIVFQDLDIAHIRNSNWHTQVWANGEPDAFITFDVNYMASTGAIPHYDTSLGIIDSLLDDGADADFSPMGAGNIVKYMPATGGRVDIGILPEWTTNFLISQSEVAYDLMMANGDAAGSVPWHYVDEATGNYVSVIDRPGLWLDNRQNGGTDALATKFTTPGWALDSSHHPSLSYLPYLVSGDQYHLDNMLAAATFQLGRVGVRERGADGALFVDRLAHQQVRGTAWALRTVSEVAFLSPDDNSLTAEMQKILSDNLDYLVQNNITDGTFDAFGQIEGFFESYSMFATNSEYGRVSPWMNDYLVSVLGLLADRGYTQASELVEWTSGYTTGRYTNLENGFDPVYGSSYRIRVIDPETNEYNTTWDAAFQDTQDFGGLHTGYAYSADSFTATARAALANTVSVTGSVDSIEAFGFIFQHGHANGAYDPGAVKGFYGSGQWLLMPKMSDGSYLQATDMVVFSGNITGTDANELLHGGATSDSISGNGGVDWLFGAEGNDTLKGGAGNDVLFGGFGDDFLYGGAGDDDLVGGTGSDTFVFEAGVVGNDTIHDFSIMEDSLMIDSSHIGSVSDLVAAAYETSDGVTIDLGAGGSITLIGVTIPELADIHLL